MTRVTSVGHDAPVSKWTSDQLRAVPLFSACEDHELALIADLVEYQEVPAGAELIRQGAPASHLFIVLEGEAVVIRDGDEVNRVGPGEFTGEMAALDGHTSTATVKAAGAMEVLIVPAAAARKVLEHRGVAARLMSRVVGWLRPSPDGRADSGSSAQGSSKEAGWALITSAERKVIDLVASGRSNPQVAAELFLSRYTVESHLKSIYSKLAVSSRTELAIEAERRKPTG